MNRKELLNILNLGEDAAAEEIEASFSLLQELWQAERFSDNDELRDLATLKRKEINAAYQALTNSQQQDTSPSSILEEPISGRFNISTNDPEQELFESEFSPAEKQSPLRIWPIAIFCILCMLVSAAAIVRAFSPPMEYTVRTTQAPQKKEDKAAKQPKPSVPTSASIFRLDFLDDSLTLKEKHIVFARVSEDMFKQRDSIYLLGEKGGVRKSFKSYTPDLIDASIRCDIKQTATLLADDVDLELTDTTGDTALIWAVRRGCLPIVKMLIDDGARVNVTSRNGFTPYVWSRLYRSREISKLLVKAGAKTEGGIYWWRHEEDGEAKWLDRALSNACRNRNCDLD